MIEKKEIEALQVISKAQGKRITTQGGAGLKGYSDLYLAVEALNESGMKESTINGLSRS